MRVCIIVSTPLPPQEGLGFYVWNLSRFLTRLGHSVQIITRGRVGQVEREVVDGITVWRPIFLPLYPLHVHLHSLFVNRLVKRLEREVDLFHVHSPLPPLISTTRPIMLTVHSSIRDDLKGLAIESLYALLMKLQAPVSYWLENRLLERATAVSAVSPYVADVLHQYPACPAEVTVTWNGVDTDLFTPAFDNPRDARSVLTVGRLAPGKGVTDLLDAVPMVNERMGPTRFLIAGDGPLEPSLKKLVTRNGLGQSVEMLGHVANRLQLVELYRQSSIFVIPSHHEGLPTVVLEAMACGCPVIATEVGGIPQIITSGENGILVPPKRPECLADAVCDLLQNPQRQQDMGQLARRTIEERYSWQVVSRNYVKQYQTLLREVQL